MNPYDHYPSFGRMLWIAIGDPIVFFASGALFVLLQRWL